MGKPSKLFLEGLALGGVGHPQGAKTHQSFFFFPAMGWLSRGWLMVAKGVAQPPLFFFFFSFFFNFFF
jgi:hypothetical protein